MNKVFTPTFIDDVQDTDKCTKCDHEFTVGESIINHYVENHLEFIFNLLSAGEIKLNLQHDKTVDEFYLERKKGITPPKCKNCNNDAPNYIVVSQRPHVDGIKLKCVHCGHISVKD